MLTNADKAQAVVEALSCRKFRHKAMNWQGRHVEINNSTGDAIFTDGHAYRQDISISKDGKSGVDIAFAERCVRDGVWEEFT